MSIKGERQSNFELLRIITMISIILLHLLRQIMYHSETSFFNYGMITVFGSFGRIGVSLFLMIQVWFLLDSSFRMERVLKLYGALWIYAFPLTLLVKILGGYVSTKDFFSSMFPFVREWMWFVPMSIMLIMLSPILKKMIEGMTRKEHGLLVVLGFAFIAVSSSVKQLMDTRLCNLLWFLYVYFLIGYYKKYISNVIKNTKKLLMLGLGVYALLVTVILICHCIDGKIFNSIELITQQYLYDFKSVPNLFISACIFLFFTKINIGHNKVINAISKNTLDVYLIHSSHVFSYFIFDSVLNITSWSQSGMMIIYVFATAMVTYITCSIIGRIRMKWIEPIWCNSRVYKTISQKVNTIYESIIDS